MSKKNLIFSLSEDKTLGEKIVGHLSNELMQKMDALSPVRVQQFSDKELCADFSTSVKGKRVFILSEFHNSDEIIKLNLAIDALKRGAAKEIIPILPYFIYARADKKDQPRGPIGAKVMAEMIEQRGATAVILFDLHADQIQGFFNIPVIHIQGKNVFDEYLNTIVDKDTVLCSPDAGGGKRVKRMKSQLKSKYDISLDMVMLDKTRSEANVVDEMVIMGNVADKHVIIIDDMIDTFGTANKAVETLLENGAKSVRMVASHGVLSGPAFERIDKSLIKELIISDSRVNPANSKIKVVSVARQIALAIYSMTKHRSYDELKQN